jgi:hypothetical protein
VRVPKRVPYDTPRWVRTDRPVHFSELASSPDVLEVHGKNPGPIRLNLRLPPDLMTWQQAGLPIDLRYRYTAPIERDDSSLTVEVNDRLARVIHLRPEADAIGSQRLMVPLVPSSVLSDDERVALPGVQIGTDNVLSLRFALDTHIQGVCRERMPDVQRSSVDPDSTLDLTGFRHYAAMPNLALFAHAGYPFTRLADLSETVVILKEPGNAAAVSAYLQLMGRFGRLTGVPATGLRLAAGNAPRDELKDADLLVLATTSDGLAAEGSSVGVVLDSAQSGLRKAQGAGDASPSVEVTAGGSLGVLQGFESPVSRGRSVVTLLASDADARGAVLQVLETRVGAVTGDVMIVRGDSIRTFHQGRTYYVGDLPLGSRVWYTLARHPLLTTLGALVLVALLGFVSLAALRRRAARRLGKTDRQ